MEPQSRALEEGDWVCWSLMEQCGALTSYAIFIGTIERLVEGWAVVRTGQRTTVLPVTRLSRYMVACFDRERISRWETVSFSPLRWSHGVAVLWGAQ